MREHVSRGYLCAIALSSLVLALFGLITVPARSVYAVGSGWCKESDNAAFFDDTAPPADPYMGCDDESAAVDDIPDDSCSIYWILVETTACSGQAAASGDVMAYQTGVGTVKIGDLVDGVWASTCADWDDYDGVFVTNLDHTISEVRVRAYCCESCCAAQDVACVISGPSPTGWFWDGCACQEWSCAHCGGDDCDELFPSEWACQLFYFSCLYGC
jgi:hypothetical protein